MALPRGARLGPYEVLGPLGAGGMGEVYRARDTRLGREVALKVLPDEVSSDRQRLARFQQEARIASSLNHPNIITIHDVGESGGTSFIVMELAEGRTLRSLLASGPLATRRLLEVGVQVADGLAKAHAAGMVHRDLKPENVMLTGDGLVKILDFGLAKLDPATSPSASDEQATLERLTEPGTVVGTVGYMSPEQAGGDAVDFRSDQFALGAILYELATGRGPFQRRTPAETITAILREEPASLGSLNPQTPPGLARIVERCLAKAPSRRYASSLDLARDLREELERQLELGRGRAGHWRPPAALAPRRNRARPGRGGRGGVAPAASRSSSRRGPIDSLAILPFVNASGDPGLDYLSDGLTESLINSVSQLVQPQGDRPQLRLPVQGQRRDARRGRAAAQGAGRADGPHLGARLQPVRERRARRRGRELPPLGRPVQPQAVRSPRHPGGHRARDLGEPAAQAERRGEEAARPAPHGRTSRPTGCT